MAVRPTVVANPADPVDGRPVSRRLRRATTPMAAACRMEAGPLRVDLVRVMTANSVQAVPDQVTGVNTVRADPVRAVTVVVDSVRVDPDSVTTMEVETVRRLRAAPAARIVRAPGSVPATAGPPPFTRVGPVPPLPADPAGSADSADSAARTDSGGVRDRARARIPAPPAVVLVSPAVRTASGTYPRARITSAPRVSPLAVGTRVVASPGADRTAEDPRRRRAVGAVRGNPVRRGAAARHNRPGGH